MFIILNKHNFRPTPFKQKMPKKSAAEYSQDERFIQELRQIILANLSNNQFSVETLARIQGISRSHLYRKIKQCEGRSISRFIRETRLKEAMKLLQKDVANVSEIAYRVGFKSTSYFNTCFNHHFGYPPGEVKKRSKYLEETVVATNKKKPVVLNQTKSIAILPLEHLSANADHGYLTCGIHDALIGELGTLNALRVISRTSTLRYANSNLHVQKIAKELGVDLIVEGSVLISDDSLRLQLQLIEAFPQEQHLWTQVYYQDVSNILSLRNNVIRDIAETIQLHLTAEEQQRLTNSKKVDPETHKDYLRGIYYLNKSTQEDFQKGLEYFQQAIDRDPADPYAYAGLAEGYITLGHGPDPVSTYWMKAKALAQRAVELDGTIAKAHAVLAMIKLYFEGDWEGADIAFKKANSINPNIAFSRFHQAWFHVLFGRMDKALEEGKLAKQLDPLTPIITADLGTAYYWVGDYDKAIVELEEALELDKDFSHAWWALGLVYLEQGLFNKAIEAHLKAVKINPIWKFALANTYVQVGQKKQGLAILSELKQNEINSRIAFGLTQIHVSLGELDKAFYWLEYQPSDFWVPFIRTWPRFEPMRNDPRFEVFLKKRNLPLVLQNTT